MAKPSRLYEFNSRSLQEVGAIRDETERDIAFWFNRIKGTSDQMERMNALKDLIVRTKSGEYDVDVISSVVRRGNLMLELNEIVKQTRWLKQQKIFFVGSLASS